MKDYGKIDSKFRFVILASKRAKQLLKGAKPKIRTKSRNPIRVAQVEVQKGLVDYELLRTKNEEIIEAEEELLPEGIEEELDEGEEKDAEGKGYEEDEEGEAESEEDFEEEVPEDIDDIDEEGENEK